MGHMARPEGLDFQASFLTKIKIQAEEVPSAPTKKKLNAVWEKSSASSFCFSPYLVSFSPYFSQLCNTCNLEYLQYATCAICNMFLLQQIQFVTHAICNICNLQHMHFGTHAYCNTLNFKNVQFATHAICNTCNLHQLQFACNWQHKLGTKTSSKHHPLYYGC